LLALGALLVPGAEAKPASRSKKSAKKLSPVQKIIKEQAHIGRNWYRSLRERISDFPADALKGRTIVIDPGHTNFSPGADGPRGRIIEADVNWHVASYLAQLIKDVGGRALLTKAYGPPRPVSSRNVDQDLDQRAEVANSAQADLFISVHHNSTGDMHDNQTEVYYRLEDAGPSRDAANYILIHLTRNLGLDGVLLPANYRVLRVNTRPALLTEASYISNPIQESLLARPEKRKLEAQAVFLGLLDYFAHGVPKFILLTAPSDISPEVSPQLRIRSRDRFTLDRGTVQASFDGIRAGIEYSARDSTWIAIPTQALLNGRHTFRFEARNSQGNAGIPLVTGFTTDREPARVALAALPPSCPLGTFAMEVCARISDAEGRPVADTRRVSFMVDDVLVGDSALRSGTARIYLSRSKPGTVKVAARCEKAASSVRVIFAPARTPFVQFRVMRRESPTPIAIPLVLDDWRTDTVQGNADGLVTLSPAPGHHRFTVLAPGFRPQILEMKLREQSATAKEIRLEPLLAGSLIGQRVTIDPAGSWEQPDTTTELSDFNLGVARCLAALLERSGATAQLTRRGAQAVPRSERIAQSMAFKPDYFIKLSARVRDPSRRTRIGHYPGSPAGSALASAIGPRLSAIGRLAASEVVEERSYEIVNAPSPAVGVYLRFGDTATGRLRVDSFLVVDLSQALLFALAQQRAAAMPWRLTLRVTDARAEPLPKAVIGIDELLRFVTDAKGEVVIPALDGGVHRLRVTRAGHAGLSDTIELVPASRNVAKTLVLATLHR
jgi:N-acetylmuramoyl-L-alanine amidase